MYRLDGLNGNKIISSPRVPYLWHVLESNQCSGRQKLKAQLAHVWDVIWINQCKVHVSFSSLACGGSAQAAKAVSAVELPSRPTLPLVPFKNQLIQYIDSFFFFSNAKYAAKYFMEKWKKVYLWWMLPDESRAGYLLLCVLYLPESHLRIPLSVPQCRTVSLQPFASWLITWVAIQSLVASTGEGPDPRKSHLLLYFPPLIAGCEK